MCDASLIQLALLPVSRVCFVITSGDTITIAYSKSPLMTGRTWRAVQKHAQYSAAIA